MHAIQFVESFKNKTEAEEAFDAQTRQLGFIGGRLLPRENEVKIQVFYEDEPQSRWLPDGCRRVMIPDSRRKAMGIQL